MSVKVPIEHFMYDGEAAYACSLSHLRDRGLDPFRFKTEEGGEPQAVENELLLLDGIVRLERGYRFGDFAGALAFTDAVGALAEAEGHHPAILTEWGRVTVTWWTHKIRGLHRNDFIMAAKSDAAYAASTAHG